MGWCPVDCVSIVDLLDESEIAARHLIRQYNDLNEIFPKPQGLFAETATESNDEPISAWDLQLVVQGKLIENFINLNSSKIIACSPAGVTFKISRVLTRPPLYNHWYSCDEVFQRHPELLYIDIYLGVIDLKGAAKRFEGRIDSVSVKSWTEDVLSVFAHLDGWSVCLLKSEVDISSEALTKLWNPHQPQKISTAGRPRIAPDAARRYRSLYPNGHEAAGKTWKEVEGELGVSHKTIKAGLMELQEEIRK